MTVEAATATTARSEPEFACGDPSRRSAGACSSIWRSRSGPSSRCSRSTGRFRPRSSSDATSRRAISFPGSTLRRAGRACSRSDCRPTRSSRSPTSATSSSTSSSTASSSRVGASALAVVIGSLAAYGLSRFDYKFGRWRNKDISFFFLSQLILPPVVLAMPFLVLYKELALLDTRIGLILVYTLMVLPIVIWVMRDQFDTIPNEMEQAALVDGCSIWGAFFRIVLPIALPGMVAAFILSLVLCWNEYFFASLLTGFDAQTLPVMVASQTGSPGHQLVDDGGARRRRRSRRWC